MPLFVNTFDEKIFKNFWFAEINFHFNDMTYAGGYAIINVLFYERI
jgi:hypothetical protein